MVVGRLWWIFFELDMVDFDVILGMDWYTLFMHYLIVDPIRLCLVSLVNRLLNGKVVP